MTNKDALQRFIFENAPVRGELIHLEQSFQTIIKQHDYPPLISQLLGEALCVAGLLSAIIKFEGKLSVQFRGEGQLKLLLAQCDNQFQLRGLAKWDGELSQDDLMHAFSQGILVVTINNSTSKNSYQGIVPWQGDSLAKSIEGYFRHSEQLATHIWLTVSETQAAGMLLQVIPEADHQRAGIQHQITQPLWAHITGRAACLHPKDLLEKEHARLLEDLFPEDEIRMFQAIPIKFHCPCSRKRGENAILVLGRDEAMAELKDKQSIIVTCEFCNREQVFARAEVEKLFATNPNPPSDTLLH